MSTIIIEGPDGAGKSTLLRKLLGNYPEYSAAPRPCSSLGGPLYGTDMIAYLSQHGGLTQAIYDRHPSVSGAVYDAVLHRAPDVVAGPYLRGAFHWITENARIIYCRPPMDLIVRSVTDGPQMAGVARGIYRIVDMYDSLMGNIIPHEVYDWTKDDLPSL